MSQAACRTRVLSVAQAFKGTLTAARVAVALDRASALVTSNKRTVIASDGGDGLLDAMASSFSRRSQVVVAGPFGAPLEAEVGWLDDNIAMVESRLICGLSIAETMGKDPMRASTRGVGEALLQLGNAGAQRVVIGLGGSASVDGGTGFARALGWHFLNDQRHELPDGGGALADVRSVRPGPPSRVRVVGLADVLNPLLGPAGAALYAPQKGAVPEQVMRLSTGLDRLVSVLERDDPIARSRAQSTSAGAAGGLGFGLVHFAGGALVSGSAWVLDRLGFDGLLAEADVVVTGEGAFDSTSLEGKLTGEVVRRAQAAGVPVALVAPRAAAVPPGVVVESGQGQWSAEDVARAAERALRRVLRLPLS